MQFALYLPLNVCMPQPETTECLHTRPAGPPSAAHLEAQRVQRGQAAPGGREVQHVAALELQQRQLWQRAAGQVGEVELRGAGLPGRRGR